MRYRKIVAAMIGCLGIACALPVLSCAQNPSGDTPLRITSEIDKKNPGIGDRIVYTVRVAWRQDIEIQPPSVKNLGDFELRDFSTRSGRFFGRKNLTLRFVISAYEPGAHTIASLLFKYRLPGQKEWSEAKLPQRTVQIQSLVPVTPTPADIRDIKGPIGLPGSLPWKLLLFLGVVAAGSVLYVYLGKKHSSKAVVCARPAHEVAYEQLEKLRNKGFIRQGKVKEFYSELSDIVRRYLENRFSLKAPEMTTEEFLVFVRDYSALQPEHKNVLKDFLSSCDLVKFAKFLPPLQDSDLAFEAARRFVDETKVTEALA